MHYEGIEGQSYQMHQMGLEKAKQVIADYSRWIETPMEAQGVLNRYHQERIKFPVKTYCALYVLTCERTYPFHAADPKRADRSFGQALRKARTGSRRG